MNESIGSRLKRLRKAAHLTQTALAARVGMQQGAIGNLESHARGYGASVVSIAGALGVSPEYLLLETDDPTPQGKTPAVDDAQPELNFLSPVMESSSQPLTPEAIILARLFDRLPRDSQQKLVANQACLQAIIDALQPAPAPYQRPVQPASAGKQAA